MIFKMKQICKNCKYWKKDITQIYEDMEKGECKRYPKEEVKINDDWCGEWKKKKKIN